MLSRSDSQRTCRLQRHAFRAKRTSNLAAKSTLEDFGGGAPSIFGAATPAGAKALPDDEGSDSLPLTWNSGTDPSAS